MRNLEDLLELSDQYGMEPCDVDILPPVYAAVVRAIQAAAAKNEEVED